MIAEPSAETRPRAPARREGLTERGRAWLSRWILSPLAGMTLGAWLRVLRENRFHVSPLYWPRATLTTVQSVFNSVDARRERRRFGPRLAATRVDRPIFVLGHYRSGTTHLHNLLCVDPQFTYANNLAATFARTFLTTEDAKRRWGARITMRRRPQDDVKLDLEVPGEDELALCAATGLSTHMAWHFPRRAQEYERYLTLEDASDDERRAWKAALDEFVRKLTLKAGGKTVVLKSPTHTAKVRTLALRMYSCARVRHGPSRPNSRPPTAWRETGLAFRFRSRVTR